MSGTITGGKLAAKTNKERHGDEFYKRIGSTGGAKPTTKSKGFAANHERAVMVGRLGGSISKRTKKAAVTFEEASTEIEFTHTWSAIGKIQAILRSFTR
jgi:general stress protein YciG